jgi:hypothetical protein
MTTRHATIRSIRIMTPALPPRDLPGAATGVPGNPHPAGGVSSDADYMPVDGLNTSHGCRMTDDAAWECDWPPRVNDEIDSFGASIVVLAVGAVAVIGAALAKIWGAW